MTCAIDLRESTVQCQDRDLESLSDQITQGARSQSKSLDTVAFALAQPDEKLATVAAEFLHLAFRAPVAETDAKPVSKTTTLSLIKTLSRLPAQQAVDAAPAVLYAAVAIGLEQQLYTAVESHSYKRLPSRAYRYLMAAGGMRTWGKVMELAKSNELEVALAGLEAPTLMREKTADQRVQICDWYKSLVDDPRAVIATRASGHLIVCGPAYIEQLLSADEERVRNPDVTKIPLGSYEQMCAPGVSAVIGPTPEQCGRLKSLLVAVLEGTRFEVFTRVDALTQLTANFIGKDVLALAGKYSRDKQPLLAARAADSAKQLTDNLAARAPTD